MSQQTDLLREIAAAISSGAPDRISDWFTEDFRLHEPGKPALPVGREGIAGTTIGQNQTFDSTSRLQGQCAGATMPQSSAMRPFSKR